MKVKIIPLNRRSKNRVKEWGSIFLKEENSNRPNSTFVWSLCKKWCGWFDNNEVKIEESVKNEKS